ncbi:MAG: DUF2092 domain-containing protein [Chthonomonadales bacterium]
MQKLARVQGTAMRRDCCILTCAVMVLMLPGAVRAQVEPSARAALDAIVRAYRDIRTLQQDTVYAASGTALSLLSSRLVLQKPNHLLLEVRQNVEGNLRPVLRRYLCDGRTLFAYDQSKNQYTQEKAPRNMAGFRYLATSLEMVAITGIDPFAGMERQVRSANLGTPQVIDGVPCDDVFLDLVSAEGTEVVHIFAGQKDHLVRRFTLDATGAGAQPGSEKAPTTWSDGQPLPGETSARRAGPVHFEYENHVIADEKIREDVFRWIAPAGAMRFNPDPGAYKDQREGRSRTRWVLSKPMDLSRATRPSDLSRPTKTITAKELVERAVQHRDKPK